jgi:hypothetical protein
MFFTKRSLQTIESVAPQSTRPIQFTERNNSKRRDSFSGTAWKLSMQGVLAQRPVVHLVGMLAHHLLAYAPWGPILGMSDSKGLGCMETDMHNCKTIEELECGSNPNGHVSRRETTLPQTEGRSTYELGPGTSRGRTCHVPLVFLQQQLGILSVTTRTQTPPNPTNPATRIPMHATRMMRMLYFTPRQFK